LLSKHIQYGGKTTDHLFVFIYFLLTKRNNIRAKKKKQNYYFESFFSSRYRQSTHHADLRQGN